MSAGAQVSLPDAVNETPHRPARRNGGSTGVSGKERRKPKPPLDAAALRKGLTEEQRRTLEELEHFQWTLEFVRRPLFQDPMPVLFDRDRKRCVALLPDGSLDESVKLRE